MDSLKKKNNPADVRRTLNGLTSTLTDTYAKTMDRIKTSGPDDRELAFKVLSCVTFARRPLTVREIQHAVASSDPDNPTTSIHDDELPDWEIILESCMGLVRLDYSRHLNFAHYTTQEHLEKELHSLRSETTSTLAAGSNTPTLDILATTCLKYVSMSCFNGAICVSREQFLKRLTEYPFYSYASRHWGHHVRYASPELQERILDFLADKERLAASVQVLIDSDPFMFDGYDKMKPEQLGRRIWLRTSGLST